MADMRVVQIDITKDITVCGAILIHAGVKPFQNASTPSVLTNLAMQSPSPEYCGFPSMISWFCSRDFMTSAGVDAL